MPPMPSPFPPDPTFPPVTPFPATPLPGTPFPAMDGLGFGWVPKEGIILGLPPEGILNQSQVLFSEIGIGLELG